MSAFRSWWEVLIGKCKTYLENKDYIYICVCVCVCNLYNLYIHTILWLVMAVLFLLRFAKFDHLSVHKSSENQLQNRTLAAQSAPLLFCITETLYGFRNSCFVWLSVEFILTHLFPSMTVFMIITDMLLITQQNHLVFLLKEHIVFAFAFPSTHKLLTEICSPVPKQNNRSGVWFTGRERNFFLHTGTGYHSLGVISTLDYLTWYESAEHEADHVQSKAIRHSAWFQAFAAKYLRTTLFWVVTHRESKKNQSFWIVEPWGWDR
jgi:hypothetical protein